MIDSGRSGRFPLTRVLSIGRFRSSAFYMGVFSLVNLRHSRISSRWGARRFDAPTGDDDCARSRAAHFARASPPRARPSPSASPARSRSPRVSRTPPLPRRAPRRAARHAPRDGVRHRGERQVARAPTNAATPAPGTRRRGAQGRQAPRDARHPRRDARQVDSEDESVRARAPPDTPARSDRIPPPRARQSFVVSSRTRAPEPTRRLTTRTTPGSGPQTAPPARPGLKDRVLARR